MKNLTNYFISRGAAFLLALLCFVSFAKAQGFNPCTSSCTDRTTNVNGEGIYICATTSLPPCAQQQCTTDCPQATPCTYYSIRNNTCATVDHDSCIFSVDIVGISIGIRKDLNSSKWMICKPLKNFGTDCYTYEYSVNSVDLGYVGYVDTCIPWPVQDSCHTFNLDFVDPTATLIHGFPVPPKCTSSSDLDWHIPCTDEFSFTLCGADNGANCCGTDITLTFQWFDGITTHTCARTYSCITATSGVCNEKSCP